MVASSFHTGVNLQGFHFEDSIFTVALHAGIVKADEGKAVTKDGTVANMFKLAGAGDPVDGRLLVVEDRTVEGQLVGSVEFRFLNILPIKSGETVLVGDTVIGGAAGEVKSGVVGYTMPAAVSAAAAATQSGSYVQADVQTIATLANALKTTLNSLITNLTVAQAHRDNIVVAVSGSNAIVMKV